MVMSGGTWLAPLVRARLAARLNRVCDIFLPQRKMKFVAAHTAGGHHAARRPRDERFACNRINARARVLAAEFARALLSVSPSSRTKGAGKAGRRLAPEVRTRKTHAGLTTGVAGRPAFPAQWFYGLWRALPGERCTIAPVALRFS